MERYYYTHAAYKLWSTQYQYVLDIFITRLTELRIKLAELAWEEESKQDIEKAIYEIDEKLRDATPRDFESEDHSLKTSEIFLENLKVLINMIGYYGRFKLNLSSVYEQEKKRASKVGEEYSFSEKLLDIQNKLDEAFEKHQALEQETLSEEQDDLSEQVPKSQARST